MQRALLTLSLEQLWAALLSGFIVGLDPEDCAPGASSLPDGLCEKWFHCQYYIIIIHLSDNKLTLTDSSLIRICEVDIRTHKIWMLLLTIDKYCIWVYNIDVHVYLMSIIVKNWLNAHAWHWSYMLAVVPWFNDYQLFHNEITASIWSVLRASLQNDQ